MAWSPEQYSNARTIAQVGHSMGASQRDIQIALMTAMQESGLRNLRRGDRDSQGLFQQRPSQGWGSVQQVTNTSYSTRKFYESLLKDSQRNSRSMTQAAQRVQRSAYPNAYARHEQEAFSLLSQLGGPGGSRRPVTNGGQLVSRSIIPGQVQRYRLPKTPYGKPYGSPFGNYSVAPLSAPPPQMFDANRLPSSLAAARNSRVPMVDGQPPNGPVDAYRSKLAQTRSWQQGLTGMAEQLGTQKRLAEQQAQMDAAQQNAFSGTIHDRLNATQPDFNTSGYAVIDHHQNPGQQGAGGPINVGHVSSTRQAIVNAGSSLLGTWYAWGGGGYHNKGSHGVGLGTQNVIGVDCSGLTSYAYGSVGIRLPRKSDAQYSTGYRTAVNNAQPGDLIGWNRGGHVALYIGNGRIIEASRPGVRAHIRSLSRNEGVFAVHVRLPGD